MAIFTCLGLNAQNLAIGSSLKRIQHKNTKDIISYKTEDYTGWTQIEYKRKRGIPIWLLEDLKFQTKKQSFHKIEIIKYINGILVWKSLIVDSKIIKFINIKNPKFAFQAISFMTTKL